MLTEKLREFADRQKLNFNKTVEQIRNAAGNFMDVARRGAAVQYAHAAETLAAARETAGRETECILAAARENAAAQCAHAAENLPPAGRMPENVFLRRPER